MGCVPLGKQGYTEIIGPPFRTLTTYLHISNAPVIRIAAHSLHIAGSTDFGGQGMALENTISKRKLV